MMSTQKHFPIFAWGVLVFNLAVIAWGVVVRVTGSGAGCGSDWPLCKGEALPLDGNTATAIELTHRATSGLALLAVIALLVWAFRAYERHHPVRTGAVWALLLILVEAGLGAGLVLFELVADNATMARALFMATHLTNTFLLLASLVLTAWWASGGERVRHPFKGETGSLPWILALGFAGVLLAGASGGVAALGDTLFPADSLREAIEQDFSPTSHILVQLRIYHPVIAVMVAMLLAFVAATIRSSGPPAARRYANALLVLVGVQLAAGTINLVLLAPIWMQIIHLLLGDVLWMTLVLAAATCLPASPPETVVA
jgi:heme A synthase